MTTLRSSTHNMDHIGLVIGAIFHFVHWHFIYHRHFDFQVLSEDINQKINIWGEILHRKQTITCLCGSHSI